MAKAIVVSVVRDFGMYERCISGNAAFAGCKLCPIDNRAKNEPIGVCYNRFLDGCDFARDVWLVFCHEDWEARERLDVRLEGIDKAALWGVIGATTKRRFGVYAQWKLLGQIEECDKHGQAVYVQGNPVEEGEAVDTFDCQCLIVHSSCVQKHGLRFDENLTFDLYVEDFCIAAREQAGIVSRILPIKCRHWSGGSVLPRYKAQEDYLNHKWCNVGPYTGSSSLLLGGNAPWWWRLTVVAKNMVRG
ncbi:MAG: hypothetical protein J6P80_03915 [Kiritimatiellae bacterium]|nr:hypothetical protein [Kiritimatiellia bacterium]